jgi:perosamine synthetase
MQAAMGRSQVAKLDAILARKAVLADELDGLLGKVDGVQPPLVRDDRDHVHMLYTVKLETTRDRDAVIESLLLRGIETRVYFPPVHRQPIFAGTASDLPVTDDVCRRILSLPIHSRLSLGEVAEVAEALVDAIEETRARTRPG